MSDPNGFFNEKGNQVGAVTKRAHIAIYNGTPDIRHKAGGTEVVVTKVSTGVFKLAINNGGNRKCIINGVTPIVGATFYHACLKSIQAVYTVAVTAENANTTLHQKGFVIPYFNYSTGKPALLGVWFDVGGGGVQPTLTDPNGVPADAYLEITTVTAGMTAAQVGTELELGIEAATSNSVDLFTSSGTTTVTITDNRGGDRNTKEDGPTIAESTAISIGAGTSGFTVAETTEGHDGVGNANAYVGFYNTSHALADPLEGFLVSYTVFNEPREQ